MLLFPKSRLYLGSYLHTAIPLTCTGVGACAPRHHLVCTTTATLSLLVPFSRRYRLSLSSFVLTTIILLTSFFGNDRLLYAVRVLLAVDTRGSGWVVDSRRQLQVAV